MDNVTSAPAGGRPPLTEQLLTFVLGGDEYGVDILRVQEIRGWSTPMPLPGTPPYVKGVINIRGDVVPIADLRERLGLEHLPYGPTTVVIVLRIGTEIDQRTMGIVVDAMSEVTVVAKADIKPPPNFKHFHGGNSSKAAMTSGIATIQEKMITILDVDQIFHTGTAAEAS